MVRELFERLRVAQDAPGTPLERSPIGRVGFRRWDRCITRHRIMVSDGRSKEVEHDQRFFSVTDHLAVLHGLLSVTFHWVADVPIIR